MKGFSKHRRLVPILAIAAVVIPSSILLIQSFLGRTGATEAARQPGLNVLLITVDTLRADAPGFSGRRSARTLWLDRLAAGGARFTAAYAHNTVTLPSHANILSGRLPFEHGVRDNGGARFPPSVETLATRLKRSGYRTGAFVSAFPLESRFGLARGFDVYDDQFADRARPAFLEQERAGAETVSLARRWIDAGGPQPFFCWVHLYEPHYPYKPDYDSDVAAVDVALQPLIEPILDAGSAGRTLVVFTSDHGESLGEHGEATHGIFAYDATLRVPLVLFAPRLWGATIVDTPAFHVDLMPTVLDAIGAAPAAGLAGRSLLSAIHGENPPARPLYFEALSGMLNRGWAPLRGVVGAGFKYIDLPVPELYDLSRDPGERLNLAAAFPARVRELQSVLQDFQTQSGGPQAAAVRENADVRDRLRALGYVTAVARQAVSYTADDDPKRLIELDRMLQEVVALYLDGDLRQAIERCRELVSRRPQMAVSWLHLAHLEREAGNLPAAIDALNRARALEPDDAQTAALLGSYLTEAGRAAAAVALLEPLASRPDADPQVLEADALGLARLGRHDDALSALDRARTADPTSAAVLVHVGTVQLMAGRPDRARAAFEEALALNPVLPRAHSSLAALAAETGDGKTALAHWQSAVAQDPGEFRTVLGVSVGLIQHGRAHEARPYLEFFAASAPTAPFGADVARAREWLRKTPTTKTTEDTKQAHEN